MTSSNRGGEEGFDGGAVVPFGDEDVVVGELSFADGFGMAERELGAEAVADEGLIAPAVIVAFELEVFGAAGGGAGEAEGEIDDVGAGV